MSKPPVRRPRPLEGPQEEVTAEGHILSVSKDAGGKVRVPGVEEPIDIPASDFLMVKWSGGLGFDVVKNPALAEGKKGLAVWKSTSGAYSLHKRAPPRARAKPTTPSERGGSGRGRGGSGRGGAGRGRASSAAAFDDDRFSDARLDKRSALKNAGGDGVYSSKHVRAKESMRQKRS